VQTCYRADPFIHKDLNYDPIKDFVPITRVGSQSGHRAPFGDIAHTPQLALSGLADPG
jgi:hypothetical protein